MAGGDLLTVKEAASRLTVSRETVRRWIAEGRMSALRVGPKSTRVPAAEVRRLLKEATGAVA